MPSISTSHSTRFQGLHVRFRELHAATVEITDGDDITVGGRYDMRGEKVDAPAWQIEESKRLFDAWKSYQPDTKLNSSLDTIESKIPTLSSNLTDGQAQQLNGLLNKAVEEYRFQQNKERRNAFMKSSIEPTLLRLLQALPLDSQNRAMLNQYLHGTVETFNQGGQTSPARFQSDFHSKEQAISLLLRPPTRYP